MPDISSFSTLKAPGRMIDDQVVIKDGPPGQRHGEKFVVPIIQEIRRNGVVARRLEYLVYITILRVDTNESPSGYQIVNYTVSPI